MEQKRIEDAAGEVHEHLALIDNVRALQDGQKDLADALVRLNERLVKLEASLPTVLAEAKLEAVKEAQAIVNAVQGGLYDRLQAVTSRVERIDSEKQSENRLIGGNGGTRGD